MDDTVVVIVSEARVFLRIARLPCGSIQSLSVPALASTVQDPLVSLDPEADSVADFEADWVAESDSSISFTEWIAAKFERPAGPDEAESVEVLEVDLST